MTTIPVVVHRLYGSRVERVVARRPPPRSGSRLRSRLHPLGGPPLFESTLVAGATFSIPRIDRSHGTHRTREEIAALFSPEPRLEFTGGVTVNDIWAVAGLEFRLVDSLDQMIDSDLADMMSTDYRVYGPVVQGFCRPGAVNLLLPRSLVGARGRADRGFELPRGPWWLAFLADLDGLSPSRARWELDVHVLGHEFGHLLGLPHMPDPSNVMRPAVGGDATILVDTQLRIAEAWAVRLPHL